MNVIHPSRALARAALARPLLAALLLLPAAAGAQQLAPQRLSLGDAVRMAARQSALVASATLQTAAARARVDQQRSSLLPNFSASALESGHTVNSATFGFNFPTAPGQPPLLDPLGQVIGPVTTLDLRGRISQTLFDAGAFEHYRASQASASAVRVNESAAAEQAATQAAMAYLQALRADAQLSARLADSSLAVDLLGIARDQLSAGVGVALDVTRAESQLVGVRAQLISARNDQARSRLNLARAVNLSLDTPLVLTDSLGSLPDVPDADDPQAAVEAALRARPDIRALEQQLAAERLQVRAIQSERLPTVAAFGDDGTIGMRLSHMLATYTWGIQLSIPIFDGMRRDGRVSEQQANMRDLEVRERDLRQQVMVDVRSAVLDLSSARQVVDATRERLRLAEQEVAQARDRFRAGVAGNADVITASLSLNAARTQLIDAETSYQAARVALARAEGRTTSIQ